MGNRNRLLTDAVREIIHTKKKFGIFSQCSCDGNALLFASRELGRKVIHSLLKSHLFHHYFGVERILADLGGKFHILKGCQILDQIIELKDKSYIMLLMIN